MHTKELLHFSSELFMDFSPRGAEAETILMKFAISFLYILQDDGLEPNRHSKKWLTIFQPIFILIF